jgi:cob(I)alamin adenosyltransferase
MVILSRIYTRAGDDGMTDLADLTRVPKTAGVIEAVGAVAEANAHLGLANQAKPENGEVILRLQSELFDLGADLTTPTIIRGESAGRITARHTKALEADCDRIGQDLPVLRSFVLPGGGEAAARLHLAATVLRRAERAAWAMIEALAENQAEEPPPNPSGPGPVHLLAAYLNRASDLVFILARATSSHENTWTPLPREE